MKNGKIFGLLIFVSLFLFPSLIYAQFVTPQSSPIYGKAARNMAMGGVGIALDDNGKHAPFYNPAGLDDVEEQLFELPFPTNMTLEFSTDSISLIQDAFDLNDELDAANGDTAEQVRFFDRFVQNRYNKFSYLRIAIPIFSYTAHRMAAGIFLEQSSVFSFRDQSYPNFEVQSKTSGGGYFAGAYSFLDKMLQMGATMKVVYRRDIAQVIDAAVVTGDGFGNIIEDDFKQGKVRVGVDLGLKTALNFPFLIDLPGYKQLHKWLRPAVGFTYQEIGGVSYDSMKDQQSVSIGAAVHPDLWKLKNTVALDIRDLNQDRHFLSKLHFGLESQLPWIVSLRAGLNQGYIGGGLGLDLYILRLGFAYYAEEVGIKTRQKGDYRLVTQISSEF